MNKYITSLQRILANRPDRRRSHRHPVVVNRASLAWWDGDEAKQTTSRLVDISQGGALVDSDTLPAQDQPVWLRLEEPVATDWTPARVVRSSKNQRAGLAFSACCPYELFKVATHGNRLDTAPAQAAALEFDCLGWR
jgi:hypothetical protein